MEGKELWVSTVPSVVILWQFVEDSILAIASNQQFVELQIKEAMTVTCLNWSVAMKLTIAIIRAHTNQQKPIILEGLLKNHLFHANQYSTAGPKGVRSMLNPTADEDKNLLNSS